MNRLDDGATTGTPRAAQPHRQRRHEFLHRQGGGDEHTSRAGSRPQWRPPPAGDHHTVWFHVTCRYDHYRTVRVHDTGDPETIVVEQEAHGTSAFTGEFALPNVLVLTVRHGQIVRVRDYVNVLAAAATMGHDLGPAVGGMDQ